MDGITINGIRFSASDIRNSADFLVKQGVDRELAEFVGEFFSESKTMNLYTSGSTGKPKLITAEKSKMVASAKMTIDFLNLKQGDTALLCMPLRYIAGKMMVVRAVVGQFDLLVGEVSSDPLKNETREISFAAMVPLQVHNSVLMHRESFEKIGKVIIGGGAIDAKLEENLSVMSNEIFATYGMTETLSHIAMRRVNGNEKSMYFSPMKGVEITMMSDDCLEISAPSLCSTNLKTNDIVEMREDGRFRIIGRKDNVVCSGGIKLQIEELEAKIKDVIPSSFALSSKADELFGERLVLVLEGKDAIDFNLDILRPYLNKYQMPKEIIYIDKIPMTESGKIERGKVKLLCAEL